LSATCFGEAEVDERDAAVVAQHHVAGLEIAVKDADLVDGLQAHCARSRAYVSDWRAVSPSDMRLRRSPRAKCSIARYR
jgi:hypothetical protein